MSETTDTATTVENTAADEEVSTADTSVDDVSNRSGEKPDDASEDDGQADENREAAKYRRRAKDAEAERDRLTQRLTVLQRAEAERLAGQRLGTGVDLWAGGVELAALVDEDGNLSTELVDQAVTDVIAQHPHWRTQAAPPASTVTANGKIGGGPTEPTFTDAFRPRSG